MKVAELEQLASQHYENFPVALWLLPKQWRQTIRLIYAFARQADDFADEGDLTPEERLAKLDGFWDQLTLLQTSNSHLLSNLFKSLHQCIQKHNLPLQPFFDLLTAFKQDVVQSSYQTWDDVLAYCRYSANPIGRLLLTLAKKDTPENVEASDNICTALQLINFWQDVEDDANKRQRSYIPLETPNDINTLLTKTRAILDQGAPLANNLTGVFGFQIRMVVVCAYRVLKKLEIRKTPSMLKHASPLKGGVFEQLANQLPLLRGSMRSIGGIFSERLQNNRLNMIDWTLILSKTLFYTLKPLKNKETPCPQQHQH